MSLNAPISPKENQVDLLYYTFWLPEHETSRAVPCLLKQTSTYKTVHTIYTWHQICLQNSNHQKIHISYFSACKIVFKVVAGLATPQGWLASKLFCWCMLVRTSTCHLELNVSVCYKCVCSTYMYLHCTRVETQLTLHQCGGHFKGSVEGTGILKKKNHVANSSRT